MATKTDNSNPFGLDFGEIGGLLNFLDSKNKAKVLGALTSYLEKLPAFASAQAGLVSSQMRANDAATRELRASRVINTAGGDDYRNRKFSSMGRMGVQPLRTRIALARTQGERDALLNEKAAEDLRQAEFLWNNGSRYGTNATPAVRQILATWRDHQYASGRHTLPSRTSPAYDPRHSDQFSDQTASRGGVSMSPAGWLDNRLRSASKGGRSCKRR